jgi:folate-dependent phosphoribosylglycinamide formyltransferase PurN
MKTKIVFLAKNCDSSSIVYNFLKKNVEFEAIIVEKTLSKRKQLGRRIKRLGIWHAAGQAAFMVVVNPILKLLSQKRKKEIIQQYGLDITPMPEKCYREVNSLNSEESRMLLQKLNPDLIIVNGTGIISKKTIECVSAPFINIHVGITPMFRGVHGGYWAMATGKKDFFGATIHYVDRGVDTGGIIEQAFIVPGKKDNFYTYPYLQYAIILPFLQKVVSTFTNGQRPAIKKPFSEESSIRFHPTIWQWFKNMGRTFIFLFPAFNFILD